MQRRNLIGALVLFAIGAGYAFLTTRLPTRGIENTTEPSFFPWVITVCLVVLSAALLIQGLTPRAAGAAPAPVGPRVGPKVGLGKYAAGLGAFVVYIATLSWLGFVAANVPFFAVLMLIYGERRWGRILAGSFGVSIVLFYLFREVFQIRLPAGILGDLIP